GVTDLGYSPRKLKRLLREAGFTDIRRFHNNRKRLFSNSPLDVAAHLAEPLVYRPLAPFWTPIWLRAAAPQPWRKPSFAFARCSRPGARGACGSASTARGSRATAPPSRGSS